MSGREPYVLPARQGGKTLADNLDQGALFDYAEDGFTYSFRGLLPDGRWVLYTLGEEPSPLMMPDAVTGMPAYPTQAQIIAAMAVGTLSLVSSPLDDPVRQRARGLERTKSEVLKADPFARVRMSVCRTWDCAKPRPALDNVSLEEWSETFDWLTIEKKYKRSRPPASTLRSWIRKRGRPGNRCWTDMEDLRGQGPRAKRVTEHRLAIAVWHATSYWTARRHPSVSKNYKDMEADVDAFNRGVALIMHDGERVWPKPEKPISAADPEFFRQLVKRLEGRLSYKSRYSAQAAQKRFEGGGSAFEPTRFLEVAQQDETVAPGFFFIDTINRIPLGVATWVIAVDIYTTCILAWDLSFDAPSTVSWMRNALNASMLKPLPKEYAEGFPQLSLIGGRISSMMYDNASHNVAQLVEDAHGDVVQDVVLAGQGMSTHNGLVERTHDTVRLLFTEELPGAKMQIALAREFNMDPSKERLVTLAEGRLAMARAVCKYHLAKLDDGSCRLDRWMEEYNHWGPQHAKDQAQFARAIGNVTFIRSLDNGGFVNFYLEYSEVNITPHLMEAYANNSHHRRKRKKPAFDAKVKFDPTDMSKISVYDPSIGKFVDVPAKKKRYSAGLTLAVHKLVMRYRGARSLLASPEGEERLMAIRRAAELEVAKISQKMEIQEQRARAAIQQQPALRNLMGGDIHLITVQPSVTGMEVKHELAVDRPDAFETPVRAQKGSKNNDLKGAQEADTEVKMQLPAAFQDQGPTSTSDDVSSSYEDDALVADEAADAQTNDADGAAKPDDEDGDDILDSFQPL